MFYFKFLENPHGIGIDAGSDEEDGEHGHFKDREQVLLDLLQYMADLDHVLYEHILLESAAIISAESEEELYRLRNVRLAEKGFLSFEESVGIYQPLKPGDLDRSRRKTLVRSREIEGSPPIPFFPNQMLEAESAFAKAVATLPEENIVLQLQSEFANLCNQMMVADRKDGITREALREVVKKACGFISIGLENLPGDPKDFICCYPLADLFRVGYGFVLRLKWRTENWRHKSWFAERGLPLSFWGEKWLGVIGGLLLKRPLYFDNYESGVLYRDFSTAADILKTEAALDEIIAFDDLLSRLPVMVKPLQGTTLLTHKNFILTLWARYHLGLDGQAPVFTTVPLDAFRAFFKDLWNPGVTPRTVRRPMKHAFLKWLSQISGLSGAEITDNSGNTLERLFAEIESEYGTVSDRTLDPRFMQHFLITK